MKDPQILPPTESGAPSGPTTLDLRPQNLRAISSPGDELFYEGSLVSNYWNILRRNIWTVVVSLFLGALAGILFSKSQIRTYRAYVLVEIQGVNENFLNVKDVSPVSEWPFTNVMDDIQTQVKILQSRTLIERVINRLGIDEPEDLGPNAGKRTIWDRSPDFGKPGSSSAREMATLIAWRNLNVRALGRTRMVEIAYEGTDPQKASQLVNAVAGEFITHSIEMRLQMNQETRSWINGQLEEVRRQLAESEDALKRYAQKSGLVILSETNNVSEDKLRRLQEELTRAQADRISKEARYVIANSTPPETNPEVLKDDLLKQHQSQLATLQQQLAELLTVFHPEYTKVQRISAQISSLEAALKRNRAILMERLRNEYQESLGREKLLTENYARETHNLSQEGAKSVTYGMLKRELDSNRQLYDTMLQRTRAAGMATAMRTSGARVIDKALPPNLPSSPQTTLNTAIGLVGSFLVGLMVIAIRERADQSIRQPGEMRAYLSIGELGAIPSAKNHWSVLHSSRGRKMHPGSLYHGWLNMALPAESRQVGRTTSPEEHSAMAQSVRSVLASLCFSDRPGKQRRVIVVTSPNAGEGKTTIAINLVIGLVAMQKRVLLIDGDTQSPRLHQLFGIPNVTGLTDLLTRKPTGLNQTLVDTVRETRIPGLFLLPAGPECSSGLFQTDILMRVIAAARLQFDAIVIDTPPVLEFADARVLGWCADGIILVARSGVTSRSAAVAAHQRLADDGINVLGAVLNDCNSMPAYRQH